MSHKLLTKSQKAIVVLSILWELLMIALFIGFELKMKISGFIICSLPVILYWLGVYVWGFGYLLKFCSPTGDIDNLSENKNKNRELKRIAQFEYELQHNTHRISFNIFAFLFSPLYFLYMGLAGRFILFLFLPVLLGGVLDNFWLAWFISSTIAAFIANIYSKNYKERYIKKFKNKTLMNMNKPVHFFSISIKRLMFLSILSGGLYFIYWSWRNWKSYKEATDDDVIPALRAWFYPLAMPGLMQKMTASLKTGKNYLIYGILFLIFYITDYALSRITDKTENETVIIICSIFILILLFAIPLSLVPVQKAINAFTENKLHKTVEKRFYTGEILFTLLGILFWILSHTTSYEKPMLSEFTEQEQEKIGTSIGFIYRHTKVYEEICQKEGYMMTKYPQDFKEFFADDLNNLESKLNTYGYSIDNVMKNFSQLLPEVDTKARMLVYQELDIYRKMIILQAIAEESGEQSDKISWDDSLYQYFSLKEVCKAFDENGIDVLKNGKNRDFFKVNE